jgi:hypothetical protein
VHESQNPDHGGFDQSQTWQKREIQPDDGRTLVLDYTFQACPTTKKNRKKILGKAGPES